jgi:hypothetical protein
MCAVASTTYVPQLRPAQEGHTEDCSAVTRAKGAPSHTSMQGSKNSTFLKIKLIRCVPSDEPSRAGMEVLAADPITEPLNLLLKEATLPLLQPSQKPRQESSKPTWYEKHIPSSPCSVSQRAAPPGQHGPDLPTEVQSHELKSHNRRDTMNTPSS